MRRVRKYLVVVVGLMAATSTTSTSQTTPPPDYTHDHRLLKLEELFQALESPAYALAEDFLLAADRNGLDWRLLPSLAIVESGGGKNFKNNNILGWDSCNQSFPTVSAGIHHVASRLARSPLYRDKSLNGILSTYNPFVDYPARVKRLMRRLGPDHQGSPTGQ